MTDQMRPVSFSFARHLPLVSLDEKYSYQFSSVRSGIFVAPDDPNEIPSPVGAAYFPDAAPERSLNHLIGR